MNQTLSACFSCKRQDNSLHFLLFLLMRPKVSVNKHIGNEFNLGYSLTLIIVCNKKCTKIL